MRHWPFFPALGFLMAAIAGTLSGLYLQDGSSILWYWGSAMTGCILLYTPSFLKNGVSATRWIALVGGFLLILSLLPELLGYSDQWPRVPRLSGVADNPNLMGLSLATWGIVCVCLVRGNLCRIAIAILVLLPISLTGSRAALASLAAGCLLLVFVEAQRLARSAPSRGRVFRVFVGLLVMFFALGGLGLVKPKNLLYESTHLDSTLWSKQRATDLVISRSTSPAPGLGGQVYAVAGRSSPSADTATSGGILLLQSVGRSEPTKPYIASIYVRSDTPQEVVLSSNLASTICTVSDEWNRCITPPSSGNGSTHVQLQLLTVHPFDRLDIEVWGPQIEFGVEASSVEHTTANPLSLAWRRYYGSRTFIPYDSSDTNIRARLAEYRIAWLLFLNNPVAGVGIGNYEANSASRRFGSSAAHAHNIVMQALAEGGILGIIALLAPLIATWAAFSPALRTQVLPIVATVVLGNMVDYSYHYSGVYYVFWLSSGAFLAQARHLMVNR